MTDNIKQLGIDLLKSIQADPHKQAADGQFLKSLTWWLKAHGVTSVAGSDTPRSERKVSRPKSALYSKVHAKQEELAKRQGESIKVTDPFEALKQRKAAQEAKKETTEAELKEQIAELDEQLAEVVEVQEEEKQVLANNNKTPKTRTRKKKVD